MNKSPTSLSRRIRDRRRELGLSLNEAARRADTSAATLSRYENDWTRFEVYTLGKIAQALRCDLVVELSPRPAPPQPSTDAILRRLRRLFWDHKLRKGDLTRHQDWIVERVIDLGQIEDVKALQTLYGRRGFLESVARARMPSKRTAAFWRHMLEREGMSCTRKFSRPTA